MTKKKERVFNSIEEEVAYLRKQLAGLKGRNSSLAKVCATHEATIDELKLQLEDAYAEITRLHGLLGEPKPEKRPWWRFW